MYDIYRCGMDYAVDPTTNLVVIPLQPGKTLHLQYRYFIGKGLKSICLHQLLPCNTAA